jgi:multidrug resistance efflux pump
LTAEVKQLGGSEMARGIDVANARPGLSRPASVSPIFTWVRSAQRIPVRIHIDQVAAGVLSGGQQKTRRVRRNDDERQV